MFEEDRLYISDTHSSERPNIYDIKVRQIGSHGKMYASDPDLQQQFAAKVSSRLFGLVDHTQPKSRVYRVKSLDQCAGQAALTPCTSTVEQQAKHHEHKQYLQRVSTEGIEPSITRATAKKSWDLWLAVRKAAGSSLPVPSAGTGPDGVMFYSWDKGEHHLEAEIFPDRDTEFFYRNRRTGELWGEDHEGGALPVGLLEKLSLFV
jgi:hypothetical protein